METLTGKPATNKNLTFVQTERQAHEAWGDLCVKKPMAAGVLHRLVALVDDKNGGVVIISNDTLAKTMGCHERTIRRATADLEANRWIQRVKLSKTVYGYAVNAAVGWSGFVADKLEVAAFYATVIVPQTDMPKPTKLRRIPFLFPPNEIAISSETGGESGSQMQISGMEPSVEIKQSELKEIQCGTN